MTSDASSSGNGGWPGQASGGGTGPSGQQPQQPQQGWGPPPQQPSSPQPGSTWGQPGSPWGQQPATAQGSQWGQQPAHPPQAQATGSQQGWGQQPASQQPQQGWGQPGQQAGSQWGQSGQPGSQWGQQPATAQGSQWGQPGQQAGSQWGQSGQQGWGQQPGSQWGQAGSQWAPTLPGAWDEADPWGSDSYPVDVRFTPEGRIGRYWGIPIIGHAVRALCVIPHILVLVLFALVVAIGALFLWVPVLINGRQAGWAYSVVGGFLRWSIRVQTWAQLMSGTYPPFTGSEADGQHVRVRIDEDMWFAWIPVLIFGRQADLVYSLVGGFVRWQTRVSAYLLLLSGPYPPFRLD